jgi:leucyl/phenylalanyl-tRNA--protein transferase
MKRAYLQFHQQGYAHSVECWDGTELIGGLYGVYVGGVFSAESMFYLRPNASKLCILNLVGHLQKMGMHWLDIQMLTPHLKKMGAREVTRLQYLKMLEAAKRVARPWL